jgi:hypothetical protein
VHLNARVPRLSSERGSIFVVAALTMLFLALLAGAVVQVGRWFEHRRHLQVRADAGALAGGQMFNECFDTVKFTAPAAKKDIETWATAYAGFTTADTVAAGAPQENVQIGGGTDPLPSFQSPTYPDGTGNDPTSPQTGTGDTNECATLALDIKLADNSIPPLFRIFPLGNVHAHARVQMEQVQATRPTLPLAIPNFDTTNVGVTFVNESDGSELTGCTGVLVNTTCTYESSSPPVTANGYKQWTLDSLGVKLPSAAAGAVNIGVRVSAGSQIGRCAQPDGDGTSSYACFMAGSTDGLIMIRDYPTAAGQLPQLYGVWPSSSCGTGSPYFSDSSPGPTCGVTLKAELDFGSGAQDPSLGSGVGAGLTATVNGTPITMMPTSYDSTRNAWIWSAPVGSATIPIAGTGLVSEYPITLDWTSKTKFNSKTKGSFGPVQRFVSANNNDDGPVKDVSISEPSAPAAAISPYSLTAGTHTLSVTVSVLDSGITNKLTLLRGSHNGSATSLIECVTDSNGKVILGDPGILAGIQNGCSVTYQINPIPACPDPANPDPTDCAQNKASTDNGQLIPKGLNARFACTSGAPALNNWPDFTKPGDPRAVTLVTTTYYAFNHGGSQDYPITNFGDFYITGFTGSKCPQSGVGADDPAPVGASKADIWGYFIKYSRQGAIPSGVQCNPNAFGECVAVLAR